MNLILPTFLEIATNLTLVSLLLNLLDSEVEEFIAAFLQARARYLKKNLFNLYWWYKKSRRYK